MKRLLLGSSALAGASGLSVILALGLAQDARADNECGVVGAGGTATCTPAGNNFPNGIRYQVVDLTIVVQDGVIIDTTSGSASGIVSGGGGNYGNLVVKAGTSSGTGVSITVADPGNEGLFAMSNDGTVVIDAFATVTTTGSVGIGIDGRGYDGTTISFSGSITTAGIDANGIYGKSVGAGASVAITSTGNIATQGKDAEGIHGYSKLAGVTISSSGDITTAGYGSEGIFLFAETSGQITSVGDIVTTGTLGRGIVGSVTAGHLTISSQGNITTSGSLAPGIGALGIGGNTVTSKGDISTQGTNSMGIVASSLGGHSSIDSTGTITTKGANASGLSANALGGTASVTSTGNISTEGDESHGITSEALNGVTIISAGGIQTKGADAEGLRGISKDGDVGIGSTGTIITQGQDADGIFGYSTTDKVTIISSGNITTAADDSTGIHAKAGDSVSITSVGDITTDGNDSRGIHGKASTGSVVVYSTGAITTNGGGADGIYASTFGTSAAVKSSGNISVQGGSAQSIFTYAYTSYAVVISEGNLTATGGSAAGIYVESAKSSASALSTGDITVSGGGAMGIYAHASGAGGDVQVGSYGNISATGGSARGIYGYADGAGGGVLLKSTGNIAVTGAGSAGIIAKSTTDFAGIYSTGNVVVDGGSSHGLYAVGVTHSVVFSQGDVTITNGLAAIQAMASAGTAGVDSKGSITTSGNGALGIHVATTGGNAIVISEGHISTSGDLAHGILGLSTTAMTKIESVGNITTKGDGATGIQTFGTSYSAIYSTGVISTIGDSATGLLALGPGKSLVISVGDVSTEGASAHGIYAGGTLQSGVSSKGDIIVSGAGASGIIGTSGSEKGIVLSAGNISTTGDGTFGILANGATGAHVESEGNISVTGDDATGISGTGVGDVLVSQTGNVLAPGDGSDGVFVVAAGGAATIVVLDDVLGGGGTGQGIHISAANASTLGIGGAVGALSDFAIEGGAEDLAITNIGTITGFFDLGAGADTLANMSPTTWNLRNFADTNGDGVRETEGVAIGDFGAGTDTVDNTGTLRLSNVSGATAWDTTGQIAHPDGGNSAITQQGVEQGFLLNLETFTHSGLITLQDGAAGDLLVITDQANGSTAGNNLFTHNGGALALDVMLNDGSVSQSDVLILDKSVLGTGATTITVANAGGPGGDTGAGDGILIVNVRTASDGTEFVLGNTPVAGAFKYDLYFQNQAGTDQNWYLRSTFFDGAMEYPAIASGALTTWYSDLGALHERLGERRREVEDGQTAALPTATDVADTSAVRMSDGGQGGWLRVVGADMDIEQGGPADFEVETVRAEAGFDIGFDNVFKDDWLVLGAFAGYGWSSVGFESGAEIDYDIATVGAYATYFRGPYYLDALVKFDWLDGSYNSETVSEDGDVELPVIGLSLETGYRLDLTQGGLYLQPQAQLSFAHAGEDSFTDDSGAEIALEDADSLRGRLGARLGQELPSDGGAARGNFYLEASVNQEFLGETAAKVSGLTLEQDLPETTFEVGGGFDIALPKDGVSFTLDADYIFGDEAEGVAATGGLRINW